MRSLNFVVAIFLQRLLYSRFVAIVPTLLVVFLCHDSHSLDVMSELLNIWQSIVLPIALIPVRTLIQVDKYQLHHLTQFEN